MRLAVAVCVLLAVAACTSPTAHHSALATPSGSKATPSGPKLASGGVVEYPLPDPMAPGSGCSGCGRASLGAITTGSDGNIWFVDVGKREVGRITPAGALSYFPVPGTVGGPETMTLGPDGNIWITAMKDAAGFPGSILRIDPAGGVKEFDVGADLGPDGITAGPDGNIWFTEVIASRIVRMTLAGQRTEWPLAGRNPRGITTGPDGNLWFTESQPQGAAIGRITLQGQVAEFPLRADLVDSNPTMIIAGPDHNLWFSAAGTIAVIAPSGVITASPVYKVSAAGGLAAGPDGNIWFTNPNGNTVGHISPSGVMREFPLPTRSAEPTGITAGQDGRMWFSENSKVGSIGVTVPEATLSARVLNFGTASTRELTIKNTGDAPLNITSAAVVGPDQSQFVIAADNCSRRSLAVNSSCHVGVTFKSATNTQLKAARLVLTDDATGSPQSVSLIAQLPACRLPLFVSSSSSQHGEFLRLPGGDVVADPNGGFTVASGVRSQSQASPVLNGQPGGTFDWAAGRWVPAPAEWIAPDGSRYAYVEYGGYEQGSPNQVHVVDIGTGRDRPLPLPSGYWIVLRFNQEGIYVHQGFEGPSPGLWLVNPDSGAMTKILSDSFVVNVSGHVAWVSARDNSDTAPGPPGIGANFNEVQGIDLTTSQTTTWLYKSGFNLYVIGAANGSIVVMGYDLAGTWLWVVSAPGQALPITVPGTNDTVPLGSGLVADSNGWWIGGLDGLYLWSERTGVILVSDVIAAPAGACA